MYSFASSGFVSFVPSAVIVSYGSGSCWLSSCFFMVQKFCDFVPPFCISFSILNLVWFLLFSSIFSRAGSPGDQQSRELGPWAARRSRVMMRANASGHDELIISLSSNRKYESLTIV